MKKLKNMKGQKNFLKIMKVNLILYLQMDYLVLIKNIIIQEFK